MRTTVNIDDELLARVKVVAARTHQTIGSVLEDAIRQALNAETQSPPTQPLPDFAYPDGLQVDVDLYDHDAMAALLYDGASGHALS